MATVFPPTDKIIQEKFNEYALSVGSVANAWNYFQSILANVFALMCRPANEQIMLAVWYSQHNDRSQRRLLRATIAAGAFEIYHKDWYNISAKNDMIWLLNEADNIGLKRDVAVHTPCALFTNVDETKIASAYYTGNPMAKQMKDKQILQEFKLSQLRAETLAHFAKSIEHSLRNQLSWPQKRPTLSR